MSQANTEHALATFAILLYELAIVWSCLAYIIIYNEHTCKIDYTIVTMSTTDTDQEKWQFCIQLILDCCTTYCSACVK